jgi:hypothetical protein
MNLSLVAALATATLASNARAQDGPTRLAPPWQTLRVGMGTGLIASDLRIGGKAAGTLGPAVAFSGEAGYTRSLTQAFGAVAILNIGTWPDRWANLAGEDRYRIGLAVGGALRLPYGGGRTPAYFFVSVASGPTISWIETPVHVGVSETYRPGLGLSGGARAGLDLPVVGAHGVFFSVAALTYATWLVRRTHVLQSPIVGVERYRIFELHCLVMAGYVWEGTPE